MVNANAFFGIKANEDYIRAGGKWYNSDTSECYNGVYEGINADFRAYDTLEESAADYFNLVCGWDNYQDAWNQSDYHACIEGIQNSDNDPGEFAYATDPNYVGKIINIIEGYNLTRFDEVINGSITPAPAPTAEGNVYIVKSGDTLSGIAAIYGTSYQHLAEINGIDNPNLIYEGQSIIIDGSAPQESYEPIIAPVEDSRTFYEVQPGDSLWAISERFYGNGSRYGEIKDANQLTSDTIFSGQSLLIP